MEKDKKLKQIKSVSLSPERIEIINRFCKENDCSFSAAINMAFDAFLKLPPESRPTKRGKLSPASLRRKQDNAMARWDNFCILHGETLTTRFFGPRVLCAERGILWNIVDSDPRQFIEDRKLFWKLNYSGLSLPEDLIIELSAGHPEFFIESQAYINGTPGKWEEEL